MIIVEIIKNTVKVPSIKNKLSIELFIDLAKIIPKLLQLLLFML